MNAYAWNPNSTNFKTRGAHIEERIAKKQAVKSSEKDEKAKVRARDKTCRWPRCKPVTRLECAHVVSKGAGGDKGTRSLAKDMIQLCYRHHQGKVSLHSGDLEVRPETAAGADGPVAFWQRSPEGLWYCVAFEVRVGVTERQARKTR
jgi:hypothetical protein